MEEDCTEGQGPTFSPVQAMSCYSARTPLTITLCHRVVLGSSCGPISNPGWSGSSGGTRSSVVKDPACRILRPLEPGSGQGGLSSGCGRTPWPRATSRASWRSTGWRRCCCSRCGKGPVGVRRPEGAEGPGSISSDLAADYDVPGLAREVALSPSRLSHLFKQEVGEPVMGAVIRLRLNQAARLLEHTVDDIGAIAREVGSAPPTTSAGNSGGTSA